MLLPINGFVENTLLDWEGRLAAVVFVPGCNFRCGYCHVKHLLDPKAADSAIPIDIVLKGINRNRGWIKGVVISGGEPTLHSGLLELMNAFRREGLQVKLDTNGSNPGALQDLLALRVLDYLAMDVKAPLDQKYSEVAGVPVDLAAIRQSIDLLMGGATPYEFRTTVCPTQLDGKDIERIARAIDGARAYYLQSFRPVNCLDSKLEANVKPYSMVQMRAFCRLAAKHVRRAVVRGDQ